jgi:hypothetical protein
MVQHNINCIHRNEQISDEMLEEEAVRWNELLRVEYIEWSSDRYSQHDIHRHRYLVDQQNQVDYKHKHGI